MARTKVTSANARTTLEKLIKEITMPRTKGSTNTTTTLQKRITSLEGLIERQDQAVEQGLDEIAELRKQVDFYRKQVNHLIALLNIVTRGA